MSEFSFLPERSTTPINFKDLVGLPRDLTDNPLLLRLSRQSELAEQLSGLKLKLFTDVLQREDLSERLQTNFEAIGSALKNLLAPVAPPGQSLDRAIKEFQTLLSGMNSLSPENIARLRTEYQENTIHHPLYQPRKLLNKLIDKTLAFLKDKGLDIPEFIQEEAATLVKIISRGVDEHLKNLRAYSHLLLNINTGLDNEIIQAALRSSEDINESTISGLVKQVLPTEKDLLNYFQLCQKVRAAYSANSNSITRIVGSQVLGELQQRGFYEVLERQASVLGYSGASELVEKTVEKLKAVMDAVVEFSRAMEQSTQARLVELVYSAEVH